MIDADFIVNINNRIIPVSNGTSGGGKEKQQLIIFRYDPYDNPTLGFLGQGTPFVPFNLGMFAQIIYKEI